MKLQHQASTYLLNTPFQIQLSFDKVIRNLEERAADPSGENAFQALALLREVAPYPEMRDGLADEDQLAQHAALISRLLADLFPAALTQNEIKAVSIPYTKIIFNHTERFSKVLQGAGPGFEINIRDFDEHQFYVMNCCLILNAYYNTHLDFTRPLFYDIPTADGITKHYRILYNADFLEILPTRHCVSLTQDDIDLLTDSYDNLDLWKEKFPRESWIMKGFALMNLYDATVENAVSILKEKLLKRDVEDFKESLESIVRSIYRIPDLKVGYTAYNQEEGAFRVDDLGQQLQSFMLPGHDLGDEQMVLCSGSYRNLVEEREYFAVSDTAEFLSQTPGSHLGRHFLSQHIRSFILAPVVRHKKLLGVLEVVSSRARELNSINANKLAVVMPYITDTIVRKVAEMQDQVRAVIQENYTAIHPSVQWKFRAEAQRFLRHRRLGQDYTLQEIVLPDVYPLYGQVDIKGSSEARNESAQKDLQAQLGALLSLLLELQREDLIGPLQEEVQPVGDLLRELALPYKSGTEQYIASYLESRIYPHLHQLEAWGSAPGIAQFFAQTAPGSGAFHASRRNYEKTISLINERLARVIDNRQAAAQEIFPHYYERFKTDGVEHNLYIGAAIAPKQQFDEKCLRALRLWQLQVLCEMAIAHYRLKPELPYPLHVTTLVMVYNSPISIRFRMDEKRFDIDGSYSAQYEVVKKRVDKAHVKHSSERITQAGKVTVVYASQEEEQEYSGYVQQLQAMGLLDSRVEKLELEDLQGVSGLRALRVKILTPF